MFPIINSSIGHLYNPTLLWSLLTGVMAPGDGSTASAWCCGRPMETSSRGCKESVM